MLYRDISIEREGKTMSNTVITGNASPEEAANYVAYLEDKYGKKVVSVDIQLDGEYADLTYELETVPFERIRRITGYLVGTMDHWNDAKQAEESDRVKHSVGGPAIKSLEDLSFDEADSETAQVH